MRLCRCNQLWVFETPRLSKQELFGELSRVLDCLPWNSDQWARSFCLFWLTCHYSTLNPTLWSTGCLNYVLTGNLVLWISFQQVLAVNFLLMPPESIKPVTFFFFFNFYFYFILLYNTVLVLPYIDMNPPLVYMRSQTWTPLPPPSP